MTSEQIHDCILIIPSTVMAFAALISSIRNGNRLTDVKKATQAQDIVLDETHATIKKVRENTDGLTNKLVDASGKVEHEEGRLQGIQEQKNIEQNNPSSHF